MNNEISTIRGLDEWEVRTRRERGQGNDFNLPSSRSLSDILRQNVFALINVILFTLGAVMIAIGRLDEALISVSIIMMNIVVGVFQELRAKRQLDHIALVTRPQVNVIRDGEEVVRDPGALVVGDIVVARPGHQIVVDGVIVGTGQIEVDESLLTGESDRVPKARGDSVLSGSFCVAGEALYEARRVGKQAFANKLATEARAFRVVKTPLQRDVDFVIRVLMLIALFFGFLMLIAALVSDVPFMRSVQYATVLAGLVPNGLFFMVIVAYALGAVRIVGQGALVQRANSVESLSNVTVLCMDKTGTLTANRIFFHEAIPVGISEAELRRKLGVFACSAHATNRTSEALREALPCAARVPLDEVVFSSDRKWSGLVFGAGAPDGDPQGDPGDDLQDCQGVMVLGALEMLRDQIVAEPEVWAALDAQAAAWSEAGMRVLALAGNSDVMTLHDATGAPVLPELAPLGLVCFGDELRPEARETLAGFEQAGITMKVISGDHPQTVAALARQAGVEGEMVTISGPELALLDEAGFEAAAREATIFGRITPQQKERLVQTLRDQGAYVAMIGDGVNDVLSLKKANLGIAMQGGSSAARAVADMVLLNDSFASLPPAFLEGQRIAQGMRDVLSLYLARAVQLVLLIIAASVVEIGFPYIPKHISLVALLIIGTPTFGLALWAIPQPTPGRLLRSVLHFVFGAGLTSALFGLLVYVYAFNVMIDLGRASTITPDDIAHFQTYAGIDYSIYTTDQYVYERALLYAQTALTVYSVLVGLLLVLFVQPPHLFFVGGDDLSGDLRPTLLAGLMLAAFVGIMALPEVRAFFELMPLRWLDWGVIVVLVAGWMFTVRYVWRARLLERFLQLEG